MFIDYAQIEVSSGKGGDGAVAFRREKFVPKGGPSGGNGGTGGSVIFETHPNLSTLLDFKYKRKYFADNGKAGANSLKDGKNGEDIIIKVPVGTIVKDAESNEILLDLSEPNKQTVFAKGATGGKGNSNFATPTRRTPRFATDGKPAVYAKLILELKLIADVGLVGFPNAGKSTLLASVSAAKPQIASYPFTTLTPNLGFVPYRDNKSFVIADIPGIIEDAHLGKGLGHRFLRHIERNAVLLFMIPCESDDISKDFNILLHELEMYNPELLDKPRLCAITKCDLIDESVQELLKPTLPEDIDCVFISGVSGYGLDKLKDKLWTLLADQQQVF